MFRSPKHDIFNVDPAPTNTELHNAIIAGDKELALKLAASTVSSEINHRSGGNTPLMLALKTGSFDVATALLRRSDVEVVTGHKLPVEDLRGVTPLQLACAWRENEIIKLILDKHKECLAQDTPLTSLFSQDALKHNNTDYSFARMAFLIDQFTFLDPGEKKFVATRGIADIYQGEYQTDAILTSLKSRKFTKEIADRFGHIIVPAPELTDALLFHSKLICRNLKLDNVKFSDEDSGKMAASKTRLASDLQASLRAIIDERNKKTLDPDILAIISPKAPAPAAAPATGEKSQPR